MTRIVAGTARGRRLSVPLGQSTRPTSDRAREALFSTVESVLGPLAGTRVVDLYAGSGAVGLEALSRGAAHVLLVENDLKAVRVIKANIETVARPGAELRTQAVASVVADPPAQPYDLAFIDPPYALPEDEVQQLLETLRDRQWLAPHALVAVERATRGPELSWPPGYTADRVRRYGEATLWYGRPATDRDGA